MISSGSESVDEGSSSDAAAADSHGTEVEPAAPSDSGKTETMRATEGAAKDSGGNTARASAAVENAPMVPKRVTRALGKSKSFADFKKEQTFHFYSFVFRQAGRSL